jgi:putative ABC transport system substrate-binding protein
MRRISVLLPMDGSDPAGKADLLAFSQGLSELGWTEGRNVWIDIRWSAGSVERARIFAKEIVGLKPDVIFTNGTPATAAIQQEARTIPVVFVNVSDPVGAGFIESLPRPGGNLTGFMHFEQATVGKWVELLTEIAPNVRRVAIIFNPDTAPFTKSYYLPVFEAAARSFKLVPIVAPVHSEVGIGSLIDSLGREPKSGLVVTPDSFSFVHRSTIISRAARNDVPTVYFRTDFAKEGGLLAYGPDETEITRRGALYVDRILCGAMPADLPVQFPTKFEMIVNTKTATALGLTVPQSILLRADEVIE